MATLQRREGSTVWVQPFAVQFPMRVAGSATDVVCVHTAAGFAKMLGRKDLTSEEMLVIFRDYRADFEALASLIYEAQAGDALIITVTAAAPETVQAETEPDDFGT
jgi:hypothetical protein